METVVPFRAWRYDPNKAGGLSSLVAPPYDVIDEALQSRLYARSRHNVVRVDFGMTTPGDGDCDNRYTRAAAQVAEWKASGILVRDPGPSMTFVEERFTGPDGRLRTRHGFLALLRVFDFEDGVVFPHEWTLSGPKEDRFRLMEATETSLSPVFLLYDLPGDDITRAWQGGPGTADPAHVVVDPDAGPGATETRIWPVSDPDILELVQRTLADSRFVIADGHHRYETALRYRKYRHAGSEAPPACDYLLAYLSNMADPALAIYATHRLVKGLDPALVADLPRLLWPTFEVQRLDGESGGVQGAGAAGATQGAAGAAGAAAAREAINQYLAAHPRGAFAMWGPALDGVYGFILTDLAAAREAVPGASAAYQQLDVTILQSLVLQRALGVTTEDMASGTHVTFFKEPEAAFARLVAGEFQVGFFMNPTGLDQVREVALGGERMPQKATFFYPKLPTGLVFHDLSNGL